MRKAQGGFDGHRAHQGRAVVVGPSAAVARERCEQFVGLPVVDRVDASRRDRPGRERAWVAKLCERQLGDSF